MCVFCLQVFICTKYVQCLQRAEEGMRSPETRDTDGSEPPCGC